MIKNEKGFSMVIVVIFMSIAALFIGYLMGSWLISFLVDDNSQKIAEKENKAAVNRQFVQKTTEKEKINNKKNNLTAPQEKSNTTNKAANSANNKKPSSDSTLKIEKESKVVKNNKNIENNKKLSAFAVQIGAFANYPNALSLKNTVEKMGYKVIINGTNPHQVQVSGYASRKKAEQILEELKSEGYNGFIVVRE